MINFITLLLLFVICCSSPLSSNEECGYLIKRDNTDTYWVVDSDLVDEIIKFEIKSITSDSWTSVLKITEYKGFMISDNHIFIKDAEKKFLGYKYKITY